MVSPNFNNIGQMGSHLSATDKGAAIGEGSTLLKNGVHGQGIAKEDISLNLSSKERTMDGPEKTTAKQIDPNMGADQQKADSFKKAEPQTDKPESLKVDEGYEAKNKPPTPFTASGRGMDGHERTTEKKVGMDEKEPSQEKQTGVGTDKERSGKEYEKSIKQFMDFDHTRDRDGKISLGETGKHISPMEMKIFKKAALAAGMKSAFATKEPHELTGKELKEGFKELGDYMMKAGEAAIKSDPNLAAAAELMENTVKGVKAHQKEQGKGADHGADEEKQQEKQGGSRSVWTGLGSGNEKVNTGSGHDKLGSLKADSTPAKAPASNKGVGIE